MLTASQSHDWLCIHQRHRCCPSSSHCPSPLPPCTYSVLLLSVTKEERKGRGHWPCKSFLTTTSFYHKSSWPFSCCAQMLVLLHSALVKQHRFWITSLLVFHFKYLFSRPQSSVQHLYSRSCGKYGKGFRQSRACMAQAASLLAYLPSFSSVSLLALPSSPSAFSFNRLQS